MARTTSTNFTGANAFTKATATTDGFLSTDVQQLASAVDAHDHSMGKGLTVSGGGGVINYQLLSSSAASLDLSSIPTTYNVLLATIAVRTDQSTQTICNLRLNGDTTTSHYVSGGGGSSSQRIFVSSFSTSPAGYWTVYLVYFPSYGAATATHWVHLPATGRGDGATNDFNGIIWTPSSAQAITQVTFLPNAGNFVAGSWMMVQGY